jgi:hypothetical protein
MLSYAMQKMEDKAARSFIQDTIASATKKQRAASEKPPGASALEAHKKIEEPAAETWTGPEFVEMDIALGRQKHRITLYPNSVAEKVAEDFAKQHELNLKLQKILCA